jgi:hypothetical protein
MKICRRHFAAMLCALVVMASGLPAAATGRDASTGGSPAPEAESTGKSFPRLHPNNAVQWVGMFGVLLILLRGACRR